MTLDPIVFIILLLFFITLLAALIIWRLIELRVMGLRDKEQRLRMQAVVARAESSEFNTIAQQDLDVALSTGLQAGSPVDESKGRSKRKAKQDKRKAKGAKTTSTGSLPGASSAFKTVSTNSSGGQLSGGQASDAFDQFAQEGSEALGIGSQSSSSQAKSRDTEHEATLLKPPKPEDDIFSTSERRDDIWLFHTAEVEPVHPAEDMTKFRQPGGITGESPRSKMNAQKNEQKNVQKNVKDSSVQKSVQASAQSSARANPTTHSEATTLNTETVIDNNVDMSATHPQKHKTTEIRPPVQPSNELRDSGSFKNVKNTQEKVVRMTNSSSRIAAERLIVDKEIRTTLTEVNQPEINSAQANQPDPSMNEMPVMKPVKRAQPSQPFKGTVPPIPEKLKQTLEETGDNVSNVAKEDWESYKNLKNTRSLISTQTDED